MACTITPVIEKQYIYMKVTGEVDRHSAMINNIQAHRIGKELGIKKYLVDLTEARNTESISDNYQFAYNDMQGTPDIDRSAMVAILVSPEDHSHDFVETVSRNAGLNITLFSDRQLAERHLGIA